jgi:hypothetical protein
MAPENEDNLETLLKELHDKVDHLIFLHQSFRYVVDPYNLYK